MQQPLIKGAVYNSPTNGPVEFIGMDIYYGQTSYHFRTARGGNEYWLQADLPRRLGWEDDND